jgi:hypothetical protein
MVGEIDDFAKMPANRMASASQPSEKPSLR